MVKPFFNPGSVKETQHELEQFIQINPIPMVLWRGPDHTYSLVNVAHDLMLGKTVLGKTIREAHPPEEPKKIPEILDTVYNSGLPYTSKENHYKVLGKDGITRPIWVNEWFYPFRDSAGKVVGILGVAQDVTEQVSTRYDLIQKQGELEELVMELKKERATREQFVATLTHDLRTPLTSAKISAHIIARKPDDINLVKKLAVRIEDNIDRTDLMIRDLLDVGQIKSGQSLPLKKEQGNIIKIIRETVEEMSTLYVDRFFLEVEEDTIIGHWNSNGIQRILENLCTNAIKYGSKDKITIRIWTKFSECMISVTNYGSVIPFESIKFLFEPYHRMESDIQGSSKGWGLGLTLVKGITESHNGSVKVESSDESGTTFTVSLPLDSKIAK